MISLAHIKSDYKGYKRLNLKDVATEINLNRDTFTHKENSVYIALIGTQKAVNSLEELRVKHQNVCQVVVNKDIILETYLATYLNSYWGRVFWEAAIKSKPGLIQRLTKNDIANLVIALPSLQMQQDIYQTTNKIENAIDELEEIKKSLTINPISSEKERRKLDHISEIIAGFEPLLREESKTYEFKASLQTPYPDLPEPEVDENDQLVYKLGNQKFQSEKQIKAFLQHIVMKTIASFINTIGGTLVIGVHEKDNIKEVVGIDREGVGSYDKYERHLSQLVSNQLNKLVASKYVSTKIVEHESLAVCIVNCEQNQEDLPVFLDGEVYRRTGALIEKLSTKEVARLVRDQRKL